MQSNSKKSKFQTNLKMKTKQIFKISALIVVFTLSYFNINVISNNLHDSNITLFSIVQSAYAEGEGGGGLCDKYMNEFYSYYGGCDFFDHMEWCNGTEAVACQTEQWQLRRCPPGDWEEVCHEWRIHDCNLP